MLFFLLQAEPVDESTTDEVEDWLLDHGLTIAGIAIFVFLAVIAINVVVPRIVRVTTQQRLADKPEEEIRQRADTLTHVFTRSGTTLLVILGFFTALPELGISIGPLLAGVGVVGIAIGFGAQSLVKDIISGLFILIDNQYGKEDVVEIAGKVGIVEDIGLRRTVLRDLDGTVHYVPNGEILVTSNMTQEYSRVLMDISVSYAEDLDRVIEVINQVGQELADDPDWKDIIITPPQVMRVNAFGDSGIDIRVIGDVAPVRQWEIMGELRLRLKRRFDEVDIEIPFPHRVIVHEAKAAGLPTELRLKMEGEAAKENKDAAGAAPAARKDADAGPEEDPSRRLPSQPESDADAGE